MGPPFHTMPFAGLVDYSDLGLIFNITGAKPWLDDSQGPIANTLPLTLEAPGSGQLDVIEVRPWSLCSRLPSCLCSFCGHFYGL